jgi:hypothetical protein
MSLQDYYTMFNSGCWATSDAEECFCHGNGWALSDVDTWHKCPTHFAGQLHPEAHEGFEDEADYLSAQADSMKAFKAFRAGTFRGSFEDFQAKRYFATAPTLPAQVETVGSDDEIPF